MKIQTETHAQIAAACGSHVPERRLRVRAELLLQVVMQKIDLHADVLNTFKIFFNLILQQHDQYTANNAIIQILQALIQNKYEISEFVNFIIQ